MPLSIKPLRLGRRSAPEPGTGALIEAQPGVPPDSRALTARGSAAVGPTRYGDRLLAASIPTLWGHKEEHKPFKDALQTAPSRTRWL